MSNSLMARAENCEDLWCGEWDHCKYPALIEELVAEIKTLREALKTERARGDMYLDEVLEWDDSEYIAWVLPKDDPYNIFKKHCDDNYMQEFIENAESELRAEGLIE